MATKPGRQAPLGASVVPRALLAALRGARKVVEVGAGDRFGTALAIKAASPQTEVLVTDVRAVVRTAPRQLAAFVDDITKPTWPLYEGATVLLGVRLPEELQVPTAAVARRVGAALAVRPLKDERADVSGHFPRLRVVGDGWLTSLPALSGSDDAQQSF